MGDASGKGADGFHFFKMLALFLERLGLGGESFAFGDIDHGDQQRGAAADGDLVEREFETQQAAVLFHAAGGDQRVRRPQNAAP